MFHGVETREKIERKTVARKLLMYLGQIPLVSFEKGYDPVQPAINFRFPTSWDQRLQEALTCGYLVTDGCDDEGEGSEEFGGAVVEVGDDAGHVPLEATPNSLMGRGDEDGCQSPEGADQREGHELVPTLETTPGESGRVSTSLKQRASGGLGELPSEIGHVHRHGREKADYGVEASQGGVCGVHERGRHLRLASHQGPTAFCDDDGPEEESQECRWHDNTLDEEQDAELLNWHEEQSSLDKPVDHDAEETGSYAQSVHPPIISSSLRKSHSQVTLADAGR